MTEDEFDAFLASAVSELDDKQDELERLYAIGHFERFDIDFASCSLSFSEAGQVQFVADIIPVSTHSPSSNSLRWGWANPSFPASTKERASRVRGLYELIGYEMFNSESVECDEEMAWEITALACKYVSAIGAYRLPAGKLHAHVLILAVRAAS